LRHFISIQMIRRNGRTTVVDRHGHVLVIAGDVHRHRGDIGTVLQRVPEQIGDRLGNARTIPLAQKPGTICK